MAAAPQSSSQITPPTILLHIVSPNTIEVPERLVFPNVPISETIADLKRRIQDALPTKPGLGRQRIIYRGRALIQHDLTLQSVLGNETLNTSDPFTLHLVLSPLESNSPNPPLRTDGLHQPVGLPNLPTTFLGTRGPNMPPPRPASTSLIPEGVPPPIPHPQNIPFNPLFNMLPQGLQPGQGVDMHVQFTQTTRPFHPYNAPVGANFHPGLGPGPAGGMGLPLNLPQEQQILLAQHQDLQGLAQHLQQLQHPNILNRAQHQAASGGGNINHHTHSVTGTGNINQQQPGVHSRPLHPGAGQEQPPHVGPMPGATSSTIPVNGGSTIPRPTGAIRQLPNVAPGLTPTVAANLHAIRQNHLQNMHLGQMGQFAQLHDALMNPSQSPRRSVSSQPTQTVYLLSSPRGPEALLVSPSGTFTTANLGITPLSSSVLPRLATGSVATINVQNSQLATTASGVGQPVAQPQQNQQQPIPQVEQQQQQQQQPDQAGDLLRILLPLGGHLWLLVRLIGFVYLFSGGRGWWNTILLGILALIAFLAQTGVFNPLIRSVWRPVRQHVEGIINSERPIPRAADGQEPTPQDMADRLLERQANENVLRRAARRMERSAILFAASLIPGVGESQVRAREVAEREQREREEAAERARQEAEQQAQNDELLGDEKHEETAPEGIENNDSHASNTEAVQAEVD